MVECRCALINELSPAFIDEHFHVDEDLGHGKECLGFIYARKYIGQDPIDRIYVLLQDVPYFFSPLLVMPPISLDECPHIVDMLSMRREDFCYIEIFKPLERIHICQKALVRGVSQAGTAHLMEGVGCDMFEEVIAAEQDAAVPFVQAAASR